MRASHIAALIAALSIAGCNSPGIGAVPAQSQNGSLALRPRATESAILQIEVPKAALVPRFVSPNAKSMGVKMNGKSIGTFDLTPASKGCSKAATGTLCSFSIGTPAGKVTFAVALYSKTSGKGSLLSQGTATVTIGQNQTVAVPLALTGIVSSIAIVLGNASPPAGAPATVPVYVEAQDASGATIVGPGSYNVPISLSTTDQTGTTKLSVKSVAAPGAAVTLTYNGHSISSATIGAKAAGVTAGNVKAATFAPAPAFVASFPLPVAFDQSSPAAIASGGGNLWMTVHGCSLCNTTGKDGIAEMSAAGSVTNAFVPGVTPNLTDDAAYDGIAVGPDGDAYFTENTNQKIGQITPGGTVTEFATTGGVCPERIVAGPVSDGGLWFTSSCNNQIGHITTSGVVTNYSIGTGQAFYGIVVGKDGNLYVVDRAGAAIGQVLISGGAVTSYSEVPVPANAIVGQSNTALTGIAQSGDGDLWFTNLGAPDTIAAVTIASPFTSSSVRQYLPPIGGAKPAYLGALPDGSGVLVALNGVSAKALVVSSAVAGSKPAMNVYSSQIATPSNLSVTTFDAVGGPDGNLWITENGFDQLTIQPGVVFKLAY